MGEFEEFGDAERAGWTDRDVAANYVARFTDAADQAMEGMIASVSPERGQAVLDLCCGHGAMTSALCDRGCNVTGLDFSAAMLAHAARRATEAQFREGDAQAPPFDDARFDVILSNCGIMHLPDQSRALAEIRRMLKPEGTFAMTAWYGPDVSASFRIAFGAMTAHADPSVGAPAQPDFFQFAHRDAAEKNARRGRPPCGHARHRRLRLASRLAPTTLRNIRRSHGAHGHASFGAICLGGRGDPTGYDGCRRSRP